MLMSNRLFTLAVIHMDMTQLLSSLATALDFSDIVLIYNFPNVHVNRLFTPAVIHMDMTQLLSSLATALDFSAVVLICNLPNADVQQAVHACRHSYGHDPSLE